MLDVIGDNLANVNTPGFKAARASFQDMVSESQGAATSGGINHPQIGLGVAVGTIDRDFAQGALTTTGRTLDLAIEGDGFFVVNDDSRDLYTRVGAFGLDAGNMLVDRATGHRVRSLSNSDITIPYNSTIPPVVTAQLTLTGNIDADLQGPTEARLASDDPFQEAGAAATASTELNALDDSIAGYVDGDIIHIEGTDADGAEVAATFVYGTANDGTTLGDLRDRTDAVFSASTAEIATDGGLQLTADSSGPAYLALVLRDDLANTGQMPFDAHSFVQTVEGQNAGSYSTTVDIFDAQGMRHTLYLTFEKVASSEFNMTASIADGDGAVIDGRVDGITFNQDGSFNQASTTGVGDQNVEIRFDGMSTTQVIGLDLGSPAGTDGLTHFGGSSTASVTDQDGSAAGTLSSIGVTSDGKIHGIYSNGQTQELDQLQIAVFSNPGGLERVGGNMYAPTISSDEPTAGQAAIGRLGRIVSGALEDSNVDIAQELTRLIIAQRGFQVNARTITTTDRVLSDLVNLVR